MSEIRLPQDQLEYLANHLGDHKCRFTEDESLIVHMLAQSLTNGGWSKWLGLLKIGELATRFEKAGTWALATMLVAGAVGLILSGFWGKIKAMVQ